MRARGSNKKSDDQQHPVVKGEDDDNRKKTITQQAPTSSGSAHSLSSSSAAKPRLVSIDSKSRSIMSTNNVVSTSSPEDRERLLAPSSANDQPSVVVSAQPMIEVMAPGNLAEGYQFPATYGNKTFMVTVPSGGVTAGQKFPVPLPREEDCITPMIQVPVGHWRDGLWDLFQYGWCHVSVLNSCCCVPIAVGQVITRLQLTWKGRQTNSVAEAKGAFRWLLCFVLGYWVLRAFMLYIIANLDPNAKFDGSDIDMTQYKEPPKLYYFCCFLDDIFWYSYFAFSVWILRNVRVHARSKYAIPESDYCPSGCEDLCCSLVCPCFTVGQLLRHTTDYDTYPAKCCTDTGLPKHVPAIV